MEIQKENDLKLLSLISSRSHFTYLDLTQILTQLLGEKDANETIIRLRDSECIKYYEREPIPENKVQRMVAQEFHITRGGSNYLENLQLQKGNEDLGTQLNAAQLKVNELSLIKGPNWREKHWFLIAAVAFIMGFAADVAKEVIKHKMWPEKNGTEIQIPKKQDSAHL